MNQECKAFVVQSLSWPFQSKSANSTICSHLQSFKNGGLGRKRRSKSRRSHTSLDCESAAGATKARGWKGATCGAALQLRRGVSAAARWRRLQLLRTLAIFFRLYCLKKRLTKKTCRTNPQHTLLHTPTTPLPKKNLTNEHPSETPNTTPPCLA